MLRPLQRIDTRSEYHRSRYFLNARLWIRPVAARYGLVGTEFPDDFGGGTGYRMTLLMLLLRIRKLIERAQDVGP